MPQLRIPSLSELIGRHVSDLTYCVPVIWWSFPQPETLDRKT